MKCSKVFIFGFIALATLHIDSFASPAPPNPFCFQQSDSSCVTIQQYGDEHYHYTTTIDGYLVVEDSIGDFVYADSLANATNIKAKNANHRSAFDKHFLKKLNQRRILDKHKSKNVDRFPSRAKVLNEFHHKIEENRKALYRPKPESFAIGESHFPVFLVSTSDRTFGDTTWYKRSLNEIGFKEDAHYGSVYDYFLASSNGLFKPKFEIFPVKIPMEANFSAQPEANKEGAFVKAVIDAAVPNMGDLSRFDKDGDKIIDGFALIVAGMEKGTNLWGHMYWYMVFTHPEKYSNYGGLNIFGGFGGNRNTNKWGNNYDGYQFDKYLIVAENADPTNYSKEGHNGIGIFIHEFSHILGLPDFYSQVTNASFIEGPSPYDVMTQGMYNGYSQRTLLMGRQPPKYSAFERESMGWITIPELKSTDEIYSLDMIDANTAYGVTNPKNNDEYYVIEYRPRIGFDAAIPDSVPMGVLIWYINYSAEAWEYFPNQDADNPRYKVEYVINTSSKKAKKNFEDFKFADVSIYNVIEDENKRVCFATNSSISVTCPLYSSSSSDNSLSSSSNEKNQKSSSSNIVAKISDDKNILASSASIAPTIILRGSEIMIQSKDAKKKTLKIVDILGNDVKTMDFSSTELRIPFSEFPYRGIFIIHVFESKKRIVSQKFMIK